MTDRRRANPLLPLSISLAAAALLAGCGPASESLPDGKDLGVGVEALAVGNGLSSNGLNRNGLNRNGLNRNGLNRNGLAAPDFKNWFNEDAASSNAVMKYLYACAGSAGSTLTWTNPVSGASYTWSGVLGIAPGWTGGTPATWEEQESISACMAAHTNYYGRPVNIAVEGYRANGTRIPRATGEDKTYSVREAAFFGNIFDGSGGLFSCADHSPWGLEYSSARACAFEYQKGDAPTFLCAPILFVGECKTYCHWNSADLAYDGCDLGWGPYKPITTRLLPTDVFKCGDGVCQFTEHCGTGKTADSCKADCGLCP